MFTALGIVALTAGGLGFALSRQIDSRLENVRRLDALTAVLDPVEGSTVENFLLVGSDSREGADPSDPDFAGIGGVDTTTGQRSDTIMVLRLDREARSVSLLSLPRDLWVEIGTTGRRNRINAAYSQGADVLVTTVRRSLGIPVHHYIEVGFQGFKQIVDATGGVEVCFLYPAMDDHTGLLIEEPGCHLLDGVQGLQYARSRYYQEFRDGEWHIDGTADLGRTARQQAFVDAAARQVASSTARNPFRAGRVIDAVVAATTIDPGLDLVDAARQLRPAASGGMQRFALPVDPDEIDGKSVLILRPAAALPLIAYFQGLAPAPAAPA